MAYTMFIQLEKNLDILKLLFLLTLTHNIHGSFHDVNVGQSVPGL